MWRADLTTTDCIAAFGLVIQLLLFGGLVVYCIETRKIRIAAASQVEALQTPCLTFASTPRDGNEAVLNMDGVRGAMVLDFHGGDAVLTNIGNGPAVNIEYVLNPLSDSQAKPEGYVSAIPPGARASVPIPRGIFQGHEYQCILRYESLSQTKYETRLRVHNLVLTHPFRFGKANRVK